MRLKPSKNTIIMLSAVCALIIIAAGTVAYFQNEELTKLKTTLRQKEQEVQDGKSIATRKEAALTALAADEEQIRFLEEGVSDVTYVATMLQQLEKLAYATHNKVNAVRPQIIVQAPTRLEQRRDPEAQAKGEKAKAGEKKEVKKEEPYTPLTIQLSLVGNYRSVQEFTDRLMRFPKIMAVEKFSLVPYNGPAGSGLKDQLAIEMELTAFIMKNQTPRAPARTSGPATVAAGGSANG
jgi:Tfp pilus assembly protein PilO